MEPHPIDAHSVSEPGTRVGNFTLIERISEGGFGVVWRAQQEEPVRREVALKILKPEMAGSAEMAARFRAEQQALALIEHPNVARVYDAGRLEDGRLYFAMELVGNGSEDGRTTPGQALTSYCDERKLGIRERLAIFAQVCRAIHHTHQRGFIHRDIKPSNLLVGESGGRPVPKVIDFGIAKDQGAKLNGETLFTQTGVLFGTPQYMSPEQAEGKPGGIDVRSDVYGLGAVLYELLCGEAPISRETLKRASIEEMLRIIREDEPVLPSARLGNATVKGATTKASARGLPETRKLMGMLRGEADWITHRALEKDPDRRYQSAEQLAEDVEAYVVGQPLPHAGPPSRVYRMKKFVRKHRGMVGAAVAIVLVLLCGIGVSLSFAISAEGARDGAENARLAEVEHRRQAEESKAEAERARDAAERARLAAVEQRQHAEMARAAAVLAKTEALESKKKEAEARASADASRELAETRLKESARTDLLIGKEWLAKGNHANAFAYFARASENDPGLLDALKTSAIALQSVPVNRTLKFVNRECAIHFRADGKRIISVHESSIDEWDLDGEHLRKIPLERLETQGELLEQSAVPIGDGEWIFRPTKIIAYAEHGAIWNSETGILLGENLPKGLVHPFGKLVAHAWSESSSMNTGGYSIIDVTNQEESLSGEPASGGQILGKMKFSPDGKFLASGGLNAYLWSCNNLALKAILPHPEACRAVAFSPDSRLLATGGGDGMIRLYRPDDHTLESTLKGHVGSVEGLEFSGDSRILFSHDGNGVGKVWNITLEKAITTLDSTFIGGGTISKDAKWVATSQGSDHSQGSRTNVWNALTGELHRTYNGENALFSEDSNSLLITTKDSLNVTVIDGGGIGLRHSMLEQTDFASESSSRERYRIAAPDKHGDQALIDSAVGTQVSFRSRVMSTKPYLSPDGRFLATFETNNESKSVLRLYETSTGNLLHTLSEFQKINIEDETVIFSNDGNRVAVHVSGGDSGEAGWVSVWSTKTGEMLAKLNDIDFPERRNGITGLSFDGIVFGSLINSQSDEFGETIVTYLDLWNFESATKIAEVNLAEGEWSLTFSPTASQVLVYNSEGMSIICDTKSGDVLDRFKTPSPTGNWAWSPDGRFVAHRSVGEQELLVEWQVSVAPARETIRIEWDGDFTTGEHSLRYSGNGKFLILDGRPGSPNWGANVFDRSTAKPLAIFAEGEDFEFSNLPGHNRFAWARGKSRNGDYVAELDHMELRIWPWIGNPEFIPKWWPRFLRAIGGVKIDESGALSEINPDEAGIGRVLESVAADTGPLPDFARRFSPPVKVIELSNEGGANSTSSSAAVPR